MNEPGIALREGDALLIVDVQRDFLPGGRLAVSRGDEVVAVLNRYLALARRGNLPVFASRDWHPPNHCSFRAQGGLWPEHCVAGTPGAELAPGMELPPDAVIISKATAAEADAYSAFAGTDLAGRLRAGQVRRLLVGGLATDYCVLNTVRDARAAGFDVLLLEDAIRAVDARPGDGARAEREMRAAGAVPVRFEDLRP
jgi:nicotinamidase/pyrazinamidase